MLRTTPDRSNVSLRSYWAFARASDHRPATLAYVSTSLKQNKFGIAAELEGEMALVIGTYECEWKNAVEDPATRARFRHFVNSEALDANIVLVDERGQRRPAKPGERGRIKETA